MDSQPIKFVYRVASTADTLKKIIEERLNSFFIGLPKSGIKRTISEAFNLLELENELSIIDISLHPDKLADYLDQKFSLNNNSRPTYFLIENFPLFSNKCVETYELIEKLRNQHRKNTNLIYHFYSNPNWYGVSASSRQLDYFPLAGNSEFPELIEHYSKRFSTDYTNAQLQKIQSVTGGYPYLVKKVFEFSLITKSEDEIVNNLHPVSIKLLNQLPVTEIVRLKNITKQDDDFKLHFQKLGLTNTSNQVISLALTHTLSNFKVIDKFVIDSSNKNIFLGESEINSYFAPHEIELLVKMSQEKFINRDQLIEICWHKNPLTVSDSAIDKLISRLRQKLVDIGLPSTLISTSRGRGYSLNYAEHQ
ncbi:winged helix-turn-helix transcriptional regulator [Candidatus Shapirobacteria bacterium]|nr:winged helix-turn-helix transcriptional regulator [Candidatus Shapirobacteria bacterium]